MHIRKIHIENIRCFGEGEQSVRLDLTRDPGQRDGALAGWTVLAGRNGTGKSTLLKAIALCLTGPDEARQLLPSYAGWVRTGAREGKVELDLQFDSIDFEGTEVFTSGRDGAEARLSWERRNGGEPVLLFWSPSFAVEDGDTGHYNLVGPWEWDPKKWFWSGYGPVRRLAGAGEDTEPQGSPKLSRVATLFDDRRGLSRGLAWLREVYSDRLDFAERARTATDEDRKASYSRQANSLLELQGHILAILSNELLPDGARVVDFNREGLWIEQQGTRRQMAELSDGYQAAVALVFDIVRQVHQCFGELLLEREEVDGREIVTIPHEGVVLIDEVESHLHVSWQKRIGFWLKEHFPNVQFIVTTHSPFVCQAADPGGLIRLAAPGEGGGAAQVSEEVYWRVVNGGADDATLTELFGLETAYSDRAEALRQQIARVEAKLVRGVATAEEKAELSSLLQRLPKTGSAMVEQELRKLGELR